MKRTLLIGIDGVGWPGLGAAMAGGLVPALSLMAAEGAIGPLRALAPRDGPAAWVSVATGTLPETHGVIDGEEAWAGGVRPVSRASWRVPAAWERLAADGIETAGVAWPGVRPGSDWIGRHVDADYAAANGRDWTEWALPPRCAPADLREALRELRVHPADIDGAMLAPLVPALGTVDQERDPSLTRIAVAMAQAASVQAAAAHLMANAPWQAMVVHHRWLGTILDEFTPSRSPYERVVDGAWRFLDGMIGRLRALAGDETCVIVVSPGRSGVAGAILATGPAVAARSAIEGAGLLDLAPTLLARFGLRDEALAGRRIEALAPAADRLLPSAPPPVETVPDEDLLADLAARNYPPPPPPAEWQAQQFVRLGTMLLARNPAAALQAADAGLAITPDDAAALGLRAFALVALGQPDPLAEIADRLDAVAPDQPWGTIARGAYHALRGEPAEARPWLDAAAASDDALTRLRAGAAWLILERPVEARRAFAATLELEPGNADAEIGAAMAARMLRQPREAELAIRRVLTRDPAHLAAWNELARLLRDLGRVHEVREVERTLRRLAG